MYINLVDQITGFKDLTATYNLADGDKLFFAEISTKSVAFGVTALNLTGTLDATVELYEAQELNFGKATKLGGTITLDSATKSGGWKEDIFNSRYAFIKLTVNNCTGGTLTLPTTLKF